MSKPEAKTSKNTQKSADATAKAAQTATAARSTRAAAARRQTKRAAAAPKAPKSASPVSVASHPTSTTTSNLSPDAGPGMKYWVPAARSLEIKKVWPKIESTLHQILDASKIQDEELLYKVTLALARHLTKRVQSGHRIDDLKELFSDEALIQTFGSNTKSNQKALSRGAEIAHMRRVRKILLPELYTTSAELMIGRRRLVDPYSPKELGELFAYARQHDNEKARWLHSALLLSLGAGLTGQELALARGSDLICSPWGLFIDAQGLPSEGNRGPRQVPILAEYEEELSEIAKELGDDLFIALTNDGKKRDPYTFAPYRLKLPGFKTSRARSNWTKSILIANAPFTYLRQAGVAINKEGFLNQLSEDLPVDFAHYISTLRACSSAFDESKHTHLMQYAKGQ